MSLAKTVRVHWSDPHDICICRPSKFGNPFSHKLYSSAEFKVNSKKEALEKFEEHLENDEQLQKDIEELRGKVIACVCKVTEKCHGDIIIDFLERDSKIEEIFGL